MDIKKLINSDSTDRPQGHCTGISLRTYPNKHAEASIWPESGDRKKYHGIKHEKRSEQTENSILAAVSRTKKSIRHNIYLFLDNLNAKNCDRPPLTPEFEQELIDYFRSDILNFEKLVNKDLSLWLKPTY